jgi:peptidoglycan/LPS O-acetylase OafA/YrhL
MLIDLAENRLGPRPIGRFLVRRWLRTLPLYYVILYFSCALFQRTDWLSALFLQDFVPDDRAVVPVSWSLVMEEYFYLLFPFLLAGAAFISRGRWRGELAVRRVAIAVIVVCTTLRFLPAFGLWQPNDPAFHAAPLMRLDCAAYGVLAACLVRRRGRLAPAPGSWALMLPLAGVAFSLLLALVMADPDLHAWGRFGLWGRFYQPLRYPLLDASFAVLVWGLWGRVRWLPPGLSAAVLWISRISYSIYLTHMFTIAFVQPAAEARLGYVWGGLVLNTVVALLLASLTYAVIERPFLAARDQFVPG